MRFYRYRMAQWQLLFSFCMCVMPPLLLHIFLDGFPWWCFAVALCGFLLINLGDPYIRLRELGDKVFVTQKGIQCKRKENMLWEFAWEEIECFSMFNNLILYNIKIIPLCKSKEGEIFQLSLSARKVIKMYEPGAKLLRQMKDSRDSDDYILERNTKRK